MTQEAQCIIIALACGHCVQECLDGLIEWRNPDGGYLGRYPAGECPSVVPKYTTDLNAIHKAEKATVLADGSQSEHYWDYVIELSKVAPSGTSPSATAAERAEALLRTLNLWTADET